MIASSDLILDAERGFDSSVISRDFIDSFRDRKSAIASATVVGLIFYELPIPVAQFNVGLSSPAAQFIARLESFKSLAPNWDSYGAIPPAKDIVDKAISFVRKADENDLPLFFVAPGPNGELVIEFKNGAKEASAFVNPDGSTELILNEGNNYLLEGTLEKNYKDLLQFINR